MRRLDLSVGAWLGIGFGTAGLVLAVLVGVAAVLLGRIEAAERGETEVIAPRAEAAVRLERELLRYAVRASAYKITGDPRHLGAYREARERVTAAHRELGAMPMDPDGAVVFAEVGPLLATYLDAGEAFVRSRAGRPRGDPALTELEETLARHREAVVERVIAYAELQREKRAGRSAAILALRRDAERILLGALAAVLAVLASTAAFVTRAVRGPVDDLAAAARRVAAGEYEAVAGLAPPAGAPPVRSELAILGRTFGAMAVELREREGRIAAQNEELQAQNEELQAQQEELHSQNEELQAQQGELQAQTEQLLERDARLSEAMEAVADADRRKSEFLAVLSHELRNPLAPIVNGLHLLERLDPASAQARRARETIARQVAHLVRLVDDLLDITRISRGKIHLARTQVDLVALVREAVEDHASPLAARGIALELSLPDGPPLLVNADPARLTQVVGNLLSNAAKFASAGGHVEVALDRLDGGRAAIRFRDDGVGIAPDVVPKLFQPFMQAERSLARTRGGLGLGLALVRALVELHGGTVRVASDGEGKGAEFTVELPLEPAAEAAPAEAARAEAVEAPAPAPSRAESAES